MSTLVFVTKAISQLTGDHPDLVIDPVISASQFFDHLKFRSSGIDEIPILSVLFADLVRTRYHQRRSETGEPNINSYLVQENSAWGW